MDTLESPTAPPPLPDQILATCLIPDSSIERCELWVTSISKSSCINFQAIDKANRDGRSAELGALPAEAQSRRRRTEWQQRRLSGWAADVDAGVRTVASYLEAAKHLYRHRTPVIQILADQVSLLDMKAHRNTALYKKKIQTNIVSFRRGNNKTRAVESDSKQEMKSIGIDRFGRS